MTESMEKSSADPNLSAFPPPLDPTTSGAAVELPTMRPFEGFVYLRKEWVDHEDSIDTVSFNMTLSQASLPADWNRTQSFAMMPEWGTSPLRRTWIVRLPTHYQDQDSYLFHYFFQITHTNGSEQVSNAFSQLIVPREFEYIDHSGGFVHARLHWSVGAWTYPQTTELELDGIEWGSEFSVSNAPYRATDSLYQKGRLLLVQRQALPRRFRGRIWAPMGAEVRYCFQLVQQVGDSVEMMWDNNVGRDYQLTM